jgi:hypothetical protein
LTLEEARDLFVPNGFFGCEADRRMVAWAYNHKVNPMSVRRSGMMSSDIDPLGRHRHDQGGRRSLQAGGKALHHFAYRV